MLMSRDSKKPDAVAVVVEEKPADPKEKALAIARKALEEIAECMGGESEEGDGEDIDALLEKSMG